MNIEKQLKHLREDYLLINPSQTQIAKEWLRLEKIIESEKEANHWKRFFSRPLLFVTAVLVILFGGSFVMVSSVQASLPGEPLYPVKRISERVVVAVTGNYQIAIEQRAQEIVSLSEQHNQSTEKIQQVVREYEHTVLEITQETKESAKVTKELEKRLQEHEKQFEAAAKASSSKTLEKAAEVARKAQEKKEEKRLEIEQKKQEVESKKVEVNEKTDVTKSESSKQLKRRGIE